jgi:hypothetical protein
VVAPPPRWAARLNDGLVIIRKAAE